MNNRIMGLFRFAIGLAKKVLIANVLGAEADRIFQMQYGDLNSSLAWAGALCYTFQIYFDFSGYSDMAIGIARTMGFIFPENFNNPYISQNITEFWRRWHMSLSRWMRDYLYISLGGNKVSVTRMYFNLCFVFLISGFWHGAEWTFIIWGAYHGLFLVMDRIFLIRLTTGISKTFRIALTFFVVVIGWIFFRSANLSQAVLFLKKMFSFSFETYYPPPHLVTVFIAAILFSFMPIFYKFSIAEFSGNTHSLSLRRALVSAAAIVVFMVICVGELASSGFNPFIYFKF
jgi:alginate O-acetyltransferase complex protein AlgI